MALKKTAYVWHLSLFHFSGFIFYYDKPLTKAYQTNFKTGPSKETLLLKRQDNSKSVGSVGHTQNVADIIP